MIFRTRDNESPAKVPLAEMPNLEHYMTQARMGTDQQKAVADRILRSRIFHTFHWQPEAAERALGWIRTGSWSAEGSG